MDYLTQAQVEELEKIAKDPLPHGLRYPEKPGDPVIVVAPGGIEITVAADGTPTERQRY